jgi:hypothetical protein
MSENFLRDRGTSNRVERAVSSFIQRQGFRSDINPAPESDLKGREAYDFDIWLPERYLTEMKLDCEQIWSGNRCIELATLDHTKAQYFISVGIEPWILPMPYARLLYDAAHAGEVGWIKNIGDRKLPSALIPDEVFRRYAKPLSAFLSDRKHFRVHPQILLNRNAKLRKQT